MHAYAVRLPIYVKHQLQSTDIITHLTEIKNAIVDALVSRVHTLICVQWVVVAGPAFSTHLYGGEAIKSAQRPFIIAVHFSFVRGINVLLP